MDSIWSQMLQNPMNSGFCNAKMEGLPFEGFDWYQKLTDEISKISLRQAINSMHIGKPWVQLNAIVSLMEGKIWQQLIVHLHFPCWFGVFYGQEKLPNNVFLKKNNISKDSWGRRRGVLTLSKFSKTPLINLFFYSFGPLKIFCFFILGAPQGISSVALGWPLGVVWYCFFVHIFLFYF